VSELTNWWHCIVELRTRIDGTTGAIRFELSVETYLQPPLPPRVLILIQYLWVSYIIFLL